MIILSLITLPLILTEVPSNKKYALLFPTLNVPSPPIHTPADCVGANPDAEPKLPVPRPNESIVAVLDANLKF